MKRVSLINPTDLLTAPNLLSFRTSLEGIPYSGPEIGPHGGGHFTINGDPGGDLFVSCSISHLHISIILSL